MVVGLDGRPVDHDALATLALSNYGHFTTMRVSPIGGVRGLDLHLSRLHSDSRVLFDHDLPRSTGGFAPQQRPVASEGFAAPVEVVVRRPVQQAQGCPEDLAGGPVAQRQPGRTPAHINAEAAQRHVVVVDTLMRVADEEDVVRSFLD